MVASPAGSVCLFTWNLALQVTSCFKIAAGNVGGWEVTQRGPPKALDPRLAYPNVEGALEGGLRCHSAVGQAGKTASFDTGCASTTASSTGSPTATLDDKVPLMAEIVPAGEEIA